MITAEEHVSPPVDFPFYGLDAAWQGPRWLDFFEGLDGEPPWALWLGHRLPDGSGGVRVGTLPRQRYDEALSPRGGDRLAVVAFSAAFGLINLTLPDVSVPRPDGLINELVEHAENQAHCHEQWPRTIWDVGGVRASAATWGFAGGWAGFTDALPDAYVVAVGIGVTTAGLPLRQVPDGSEYDMDPDAPLDLAELGRARREQPDHWVPPPQRDHFHPDQLAFVAE